MPSHGKCKRRKSGKAKHRRQGNERPPGGDRDRHPHVASLSSYTSSTGSDQDEENINGYNTHMGIEEKTCVYSNYNRKMTKNYAKVVYEKTTDNNSPECDVPTMMDVKKDVHYYAILARIHKSVNSVDNIPSLGSILEDASKRGMSLDAVIELYNKERTKSTLVQVTPLKVTSLQLKEDGKIDSERTSYDVRSNNFLDHGDERLTSMLHNMTISAENEYNQKERCNNMKEGLMAVCEQENIDTNRRTHQDPPDIDSTQDLFPGILVSQDQTYKKKSTILGQIFHPPSDDRKESMVAQLSDVYITQRFPNDTSAHKLNFNAEVSKVGCDTINRDGLHPDPPGFSSGDVRHPDPPGFSHGESVDVENCPTSSTTVQEHADTSDNGVEIVLTRVSNGTTRRDMNKECRGVETRATTANSGIELNTRRDMNKECRGVETRATTANSGIELNCFKQNFLRDSKQNEKEHIGEVYSDPPGQSYSSTIDSDDLGTDSCFRSLMSDERRNSYGGVESFAFQERSESNDNHITDSDEVGFYQYFDDKNKQRTVIGEIPVRSTDSSDIESLEPEDPDEARPDPPGSSESNETADNSHCSSSTTLENQDFGDVLNTDSCSKSWAFSQHQDYSSSDIVNDSDPSLSIDDQAEYFENSVEIVLGDSLVGKETEMNCFDGAEISHLESTSKGENETTTPIIINDSSIILTGYSKNFECPEESDEVKLFQQPSNLSIEFDGNDAEYYCSSKTPKHQNTTQTHESLGDNDDILSCSSHEEMMDESCQPHTVHNENSSTIKDESCALTADSLEHNDQDLLNLEERALNGSSDIAANETCFASPRNYGHHYDFDDGVEIILDVGEDNEQYEVSCSDDVEIFPDSGISSRDTDDASATSVGITNSTKRLSDDFEDTSDEEFLSTSASSTFEDAERRSYSNEADSQPCLSSVERSEDEIVCSDDTEEHLDSFPLGINIDDIVTSILSADSKNLWKEVPNDEHGTSDSDEEESQSDSGSSWSEGIQDGVVYSTDELDDEIEELSSVLSQSKVDLTSAFDRNDYLELQQNDDEHSITSTHQDEEQRQLSCEIDASGSGMDDSQFAQFAKKVEELIEADLSPLESSDDVIEMKKCWLRTSSSSNDQGNIPMSEEVDAFFSRFSIRSEVRILENDCEEFPQNKDLDEETEQFQRSKRDIAANEGSTKKSSDARRSRKPTFKESERGEPVMEKEKMKENIQPAPQEESYLPDHLGLWKSPWIKTKIPRCQESDTGNTDSKDRTKEVANSKRKQHFNVENRKKGHSGYSNIDFYSLYEASLVKAEEEDIDQAPWECRDVGQRFLHEKSLESRNWFGAFELTRGNDRLQYPVCCPKSLEVSVTRIPDEGEWSEDWFTTWKSRKDNPNNLESFAHDEVESIVNDKECLRENGNHVVGKNVVVEIGSLCPVRVKPGERISRIHPEFTSSLRQSRWRKKYIKGHLFASV